MNPNSDGLKIELIDSEEAFQAIKEEWDQLIEKSVNPSFYATYPFVYTTWKHFRNENNHLFILLVRRDATLAGIAPFRIEIMKEGNIYPLRVIRFIAEWGGGDKPSIVTIEKPDLVWNSIFQFLSKEFTQWDGIWLEEQPANSPILNQRFFRNRWYSARNVPQVTSYYISITGTWEEYLKTRGKDTRRKWNKSRKNLFTLPEGVYFQCVEDPETLPKALERYINIEQSGWKNNHDFSVGGSEKNIRFYEELLNNLAHTKMVSMHFLMSGTTDIAAAIHYKHKSTKYGAHITYRPIYVKYSPGVILTTELLKTLFGTHYKEFDFLGFRNNEKNTFKKNSSTGSRQTDTILVNKRNFRMLLFYAGNRLKTLRRKVVRMMTGHKATDQAQFTEQ